VESEQTVLDGWERNNQYFTCCPPGLSTDTNVSRHCSDPTVNFIDGDYDYFGYINETISCDDESRPYPRQMKTGKDYYNQEVESYMCCDSAENTTTTNFRDETECVPYRDEFYQEALALTNKYGAITPLACDIPDGDFRFPRLVPTTIPHWDTYECCKTGPAAPPFVQDAAFKKTVYLQIAISSIAVLSCIIVILALSIPLLMQMRKRRTHTTQRRNNRRIRSRGADDSDYSTYNLYLVYLAIPDLILNLYLLGMYGTYANQKFTLKFYGSIISCGFDDTHSFEGAFVVACSTANLYLNAVVSYEVLVLLRNCHQVRSTNPPSILKVTLQAVAVYFIAIMVFIAHYYISSAADKSYRKRDYDTFDQLLNVNQYWSMAVTYLLPIGFVGCVCIIIWWRGFVPSASGRLKEVVWYFLRIIVIFFVFWIPGMCFVVIGAARKDGRFINIGFLFCAIQPIVSLCMAMTKSDVRKHIFDLITLSCIRKSEETKTSRTSFFTSIRSSSIKSMFLVINEEKVVETLAEKDTDGIVAASTSTETNGVATTPETKENIIDTAATISNEEGR